MYPRHVGNILIEWGLSARKIFCTREIVSDLSIHAILGRVMPPPELLPTQPPGVIRQEFGAALRHARRAAGFSQRDLAARVHINTETINRLENGGNSRTDTIEKIRRVLPNLAMHSDPYTAEQAARDRHIRAEQDAKDRLADMRMRTIHIIEAIVSIERLQKIQALALKALTADLAGLTETKPVSTATPKHPRKRTR
jgi:transcriptional regulator with XRE-family HTH domain